MKNTKYFVALFATIIISVLIAKPVLSQSTNTYFVIPATDSIIVNKAVNGEKTMKFEIGGLNSKQELNEFINKFKTLRGVVSITVDETPVAGNWLATAVFYKFANQNYFKFFFKWCDVKYILIKNKKYQTENFSLIKIY